MREEYDREVRRAMLGWEGVARRCCSQEAERSGDAEAGETAHAASEGEVGNHSYWVVVDDSLDLEGHEGVREEGGKGMEAGVRLGREEKYV